MARHTRENETVLAKWFRDKGGPNFSVLLYTTQSRLLKYTMPHDRTAKAKEVRTNKITYQQAERIAASLGYGPPQDRKMTINWYRQWVTKKERENASDKKESNEEGNGSQGG